MRFLIYWKCYKCKKIHTEPLNIIQKLLNHSVGELTHITSKQGAVLDRQPLMLVLITSLLCTFVFSTTVAQGWLDQHCQCAHWKKTIGVLQFHPKCQKLCFRNKPIFNWAFSGISLKKFYLHSNISIAGSIVLHWKGPAEPCISTTFILS